MATNEVPRGPISDHVVENVKRLRANRRWSLVELSEHLGRAGRPMLASGLHRLEQGKRRIDVDDLIALAVAFEVAPISLLLPWTGDGRVQVTGTIEVDSATAWDWMRALRALDLPDDPEERVIASVAFQGRALPPRTGRRLGAAHADLGGMSSTASGTTEGGDDGEREATS